MARVTGLEPATSGVTGRRSNQLSYTRLVCAGQLEEGTPPVNTPRSTLVIIIRRIMQTSGQCAGFEQETGNIRLACSPEYRLDNDE